MDIPLNVDVYCDNGKVCGRSVSIILNPVTEEITHFVIKVKDLAHPEYLVPIEYIVESTPQKIQLRCSRSQLMKFGLFTHIEFLDPYDVGYSQLQMPLAEAGAMGMWPYTIPANGALPIPEEDIPYGELAIHRGADVDAVDGHIGHVDEFIVNPKDSHITHLVMREGHLWGKKDITISISDIDHIEDDVVYLKLDKNTVEHMPAIPVKRWWR